MERTMNKRGRRTFAAQALGAFALAAALFAGTTSGGSAQTAPSPTPTPDRDWDLPAGHYYTQTGSGQGGFAITDDGAITFWTAFQRLGGTASLGYPASRRFSQDAFVYQATQAALLQWRPDQKTAVLGNTFEMLQNAGKDDWLYAAKGIPRPIANDGTTSYDQAVQVRLGWLTEPAIAARYFANPVPGSKASWTQSDAINLYGLPMSQPERIGPFVAQRFQRIAFQLWMDAIPGMPAPGSVTPVLGGDLMKEAGLIYGVAAVPHSASDVVSRAVALGATPFPTAASYAPSSTPTFTANQMQTATAGAANATATARAATPTPPPPGPTAPVATAKPATLQVVQGSLSEYSISLGQISAQPGTVRFAVANVGELRHNLHVTGSGVDKKMSDLRAGQSGQLDVTFTDPGAYTVYCDLADHADRGMTLTFTIGS